MGRPSSSAPHREENPSEADRVHYGQSKLEAERVVEEESAGVPWTILRPSGVYGPGDVDYFNSVSRARCSGLESRFSAIVIGACR